MHIIICRIVPHLITAQLHRVRMLCLFEMIMRMPSRIPPAPDIPAYQADPQVLIAATLSARIVHMVVVGCLRVPAHRAAGVAPFRQTIRMERVIA